MKMLKFSEESIKVPLRLLFSVQTLEKVDGVFFEDAEGLEKEKTMSCYWVEFEISKHTLFIR